MKLDSKIGSLATDYCQSDMRSFMDGFTESHDNILKELRNFGRNSTTIDVATLARIDSSNALINRELETLKMQIGELSARHSDEMLRRTVSDMSASSKTPHSDNTVMESPISVLLKRPEFQLCFLDDSPTVCNESINEMISDVDRQFESIGEIIDTHITMNDVAEVGDELCESFVTVDAVADEDAPESVTANVDAGLSQSSSQGFSWIYVASADEDFCLRKLKNILLWRFGNDNLRIDSLSKNDQVTYRSFKFRVPSSEVTKYLNLSTWPGSYYVRHFEESKRADFRSRDQNHSRMKSNFVHNPAKIRT